MVHGLRDNKEGIFEGHRRMAFFGLVFFPASYIWNLKYKFLWFSPGYTRITLHKNTLNRWALILKIASFHNFSLRASLASRSANSELSSSDRKIMEENKFQNYGRENQCIMYLYLMWFLPTPTTKNMAE